MGWVEPHGKGFRGRHRHNGKSYRTETFKTDKEARTALALLIADLTRGTHFDPSAGQTTLAAWADTWMPGRRIKRSTAATDDGRLNALILPRWGRIELGAMQLGHIETSDVEAWVEAISHERAPKTVRNAHGLLYSLMEAAVAAGKIRKNPCAGTRNLPDDDREPMRILTHVEFARLLDAVPDHWKPLIIFLAGTGCRWGEAAGLRAQDVDLDLGMIRIAVDLDEVDGKIVEDTPKTASSRRSMFLHASVLDAVGPLAARRTAEEAVFLTVRGFRIRRSNFWNRVWQPAITKAELTTRPRPHDLRHLYASTLITAGVPLSVVSRLLGHKSIQTTHNLYFHLIPQVDDRVDRALDGLLVPTAVTPGAVAAIR